MLSAATIELDIFSGRPNPSWTLPETDIQRWLQAMPVVSRPTTSPQGLGYRGIIVHLRGQDIRVFNGTAATPHLALGDPKRKFESWLLESGKDAADPALLASVRQAF